jgi:hypothetical protein
MRIHFVIASVALLSCTDDSPRRGLDADDGSAATAQGAGFDAGTTLLGAMDAKVGGPKPGNDQAAAWHAAICDVPASGPIAASPTTFKVELGRTQCFGTCPVFSVAVDQDGRVTYYGENFVARFGLQQRQIPAADARAIYDAVYQAGYGGLNRCYIDASDGCRESTDAPTSKWNVVADGVAKAVDRYYGCEHPAPELPLLDAAERVVRDKAVVNDWVGPPTKYQPAPPALKRASYRLSNAGKNLGTLTIGSASVRDATLDASIVPLGGSDWDLVDCNNVPRANGTMGVHAPFYVLLAGHSSFLPNPPRRVIEKLPITLPSLGDVGSILIEVTASGDVQTVHAQRGDEDIPLELVPAPPGC